MANISEWLKGITFFIFVTIMFYFFWNNIFSNIIEFTGSNVFGLCTDGVGDGCTSMAIMKGMAWVSFVLLYLSIGSIYLIFSIIFGSKGDIETSPLWFLIAIGSWSVMMPFLVFIYGLIFYLQGSLATATNGLMDNTSQTFASQFSWILGLFMLVALTIIPFTFVLKGYGVNLTGKKEKN